MTTVVVFIFNFTFNSSCSQHPCQATALTYFNCECLLISFKMTDKQGQMVEDTKCTGKWCQVVHLSCKVISVAMEKCNRTKSPQFDDNPVEFTDDNPVEFAVTVKQTFHASQ